MFWWLYYSAVKQLITGAEVSAADQKHQVQGQTFFLCNVSLSNNTYSMWEQVGNTQDSNSGSDFKWKLNQILPDNADNGKGGHGTNQEKPAEENVEHK